MQILETGEVCCAYEGSEHQCYAWIDRNEDDYPESSFFVEPKQEYNRYE